MKVILAQEYGFCFGVRRSLKLLEKHLESGKRVFSIGEIIHNPVVIESYKNRGVEFVDSPMEVGDGVGVVRAHGLPQSCIDEAKRKGKEIVDGTCVYVRHISKLIKQERERLPDVPIYLVGEPEHPEVKAATNDFNGKVFILDYRNFDGKNFIFPKRAVILSQTTMEEKKFVDIVGDFVCEGEEIVVYNTICPSTRRRQRAAKDLAQLVDVVVVLGGKKSSNTRRLYEICSAFKPSYLVERVNELPFDEIKKYQVVGITAGASTPEEVVKEAIECLEQL